LVPNQWINGADAMPRNRPNDYILDPFKDQKPIDDFFPPKLAERIRMDNWRKQLNLFVAKYSTSPSRARSTG
jgi:hypothetical protein